MVDGLVMRYGDKVAVDGLVARRSSAATITAVLGPNGAGKTTTLETCEGYRRPAGGHASGCSGSTRVARAARSCCPGSA